MLRSVRPPHLHFRCLVNPWRENKNVVIITTVSNCCVQRCWLCSTVSKAVFSEVEKHPLSLKKKTEGKIGSNVSTVAWTRPVSAGESQGPQPSQVFFESQQRYRGVLQRTVCMDVCVYVCVCMYVCVSFKSHTDWCALGFNPFSFLFEILCHRR